MKVLRFFEPFYYEFLSKFVPQRVNYKTNGECIKCAKCCRYILCDGLGSEKEFGFLQLIYPEYRKFKITGKDELGNYVLTCTLIDKDNLCPIYEKRPAVCKKYPSAKYSQNGTLHKGCGYSIEPEKNFKDFLGK